MRVPAAVFCWVSRKSCASVPARRACQLGKEEVAPQLYVVLSPGSAALVRCGQICTARRPPARGCQSSISMRCHTFTEVRHSVELARRKRVVGSVGRCDPQAPRHIPRAQQWRACPARLRARCLTPARARPIADAEPATPTMSPGSESDMPHAIARNRFSSECLRFRRSFAVVDTSRPPAVHAVRYGAARGALPAIFCRSVSSRDPCRAVA